MDSEVPGQLGGFRLACLAELDDLFSLEEASYPADEMASRAKLELRLTVAGDFFFVMREAAPHGSHGPVVGYVCGTLAKALTEESMAEHDPEGRLLCIHSVVVAPRWRRRGVAAWMVRQYCSRVAQMQRQVDAFALLSKEPNAPLYERCGFESLGDSGVDHGADMWLLMRRRVRPEERLPALAIVDAFSSKPVGGGNQAAVVILPSATEAFVAVVSGAGGAGSSAPCPVGSGGEAAAAAPAPAPSEAAAAAAAAAAASAPDSLQQWMQAVTEELGYSETAFLQPLASGAWALRWFTPGGEVDLCGHATLAAVHALREAGCMPPTATSVSFASRSGKLSASVEPAAAGKRDILVLDFPAEPPLPVEAEGGPDGQPLAEILSAVQAGFWPGTAADPARVVAVLRNRMDVFVRVTPEAFAEIPIRGVRDESLAAVVARGVVATAAAQPDQG
ncbi:hypothetical protein FNF31_05451 [Cafeteria roenbergensis]|uniref:N-acetyltransferase domain-containing protein n=1 Tax=Cafeteria roenbergensis TaxID=33653 RepID=A0A5A8D327_CAFRO|nr:hypothetical protein FNF31_05451 [Cafeteria roenbergensis]